MKGFTTVIFLLIFSTSYAVTNTWTGLAGNHQWEDKENWDQGVVPCSTCDVVIDADSVVLNSIVTVRSVFINNASSVLFIPYGSILNTNSGTSSSIFGVQINNSGRLRLEGELNITDSENGLQLSTNASFYNEGLLTITACRQGIANSANFYNLNGGTISTYNTTKQGLLNNSTGLFRNFNFVNIDLGRESAILNWGTFENKDGQINVVNSAGVGITNRGNFINEANVTISNATNYLGFEGVGFFNYGSFTNNDKIEILNVASAGYKCFGNTSISINNEDLFINNTGKEGLYIQSNFFNNSSLDIRNTTFEGVFVRDSLWNSGKINIENTNLSGLIVSWSSSFFNNLTTGTVFISNTALAGIENAHFAENHGEINIDRPGSQGVLCRLKNLTSQSSFKNFGDINVNKGIYGIAYTTGLNDDISFTNEPTGLVTIDSTSIAGIKNENDYLNYGYTYISNSLGIGFENVHPDTCFNYGTIHISKGDNVGIKHILKTKPFINVLGAQIIVDSVNLSAIYASKQFINNGGISITRPLKNGIENYQNNFENSGQIFINNSQMAAILNDKNTLNGTFENSAIGQITIDQSATVGLHNKNIFTNLGEINITNAIGTGLLLDETLTNLADFNITNTTGTAALLNDSLINSGLLKVISSSAIAMHLSGPNAVFLNNSIGQAFLFFNLGVGIEASQRLINKGNITIADNQGISIRNFQNADTLINEGDILIEYGEDHAISNIGTGTVFLNKSGASLVIKPSNGYAIYNERNILNDGLIDIILPPPPNFTVYGIFNFNYLGKISNSGLIKVDANFFPCIYNISGVIENLPCGKMELIGSIYSDDRINNYGLFIHKFSLSNSTIFSPFYNYGVYQDQADKLVLDANFINTGVVIKNLKGKISNGVKEMNLVQSAASPTFTIGNTWWINRSFITAGLYSAADDSFLPNLNSLFADSLYLNVDNGTCDYLLVIPIIKTANCTTHPTATFTQAVSKDWHTPENWDTYNVPDYCTISIIPNTKKCTITAGRKARAFRILSDTGSVFDAELGVVLEVEN